MASSNTARNLSNFEDKRIKLQIITASILVVIAGFIVVREQWTRNARNTAYQVVLVNQRLQNHKGVIEATEKFFDNQTWMGKDRRSPKVIEVYKQSMMRWLVQQPEGDLNESAKKHLKRYQQLIQN